MWVPNEHFEAANATFCLGIKGALYLSYYLNHLWTRPDVDKLVPLSPCGFKASKMVSILSWCTHHKGFLRLCGLYLCRGFLVILSSNFAGLVFLGFKIFKVIEEANFDGVTAVRFIQSLWVISLSRIHKIHIIQTLRNMFSEGLRFFKKWKAYYLGVTAIGTIPGNIRQTIVGIVVVTFPFLYYNRGQKTT